MPTAETCATLVRVIEDDVRKHAGMAANAVTARLNALEAGQVVEPVNYRSFRQAPDFGDGSDDAQRRINEGMSPFIAAGRAAIADELDELAPRIRALIEARPKPRVRV